MAFDYIKFFDVYCGNNRLDLLLSFDMRSSEMGLSSDELAFYNALSLNDSATEVLGDEQLRIIAREVADKVRKNATIDWAV